MDSTQLSVVFAAMVDYEVDDSFMEFADQASAALAKATEEVSERLADVTRLEKEEVARIEEAHRLAKQRREQDERQAKLDAQQEAIDKEKAEIEAQEKPVEVKHDEPEAVAVESKEDEKPSELFDNEPVAVAPGPGGEEAPIINEHAETLRLIAVGCFNAFGTMEYIHSTCHIQDMTAQERLDQVAEICRAYLNQGGE